MNKCLYCYEPIESELDFHEKCSLTFFGTSTAPPLPYSFSEMDKLAKNVVERSVSLPGVQAKLSLSLFQKTKKSPENRLTIVGALGGNYIFKPPNKDYPEMPQNEHLTMKIASLFKINTVPSSLIRLQSGELSYITKRVDRTYNGEKKHMLDMFQITEAFDKYKSSMERIGNALNLYSSNTLLDQLFYFELVVFSFLTGNNDMHLKNFSMIESKSGWSLAPAYDLLNVTILNPKDTEELALSISGKKKNLKRVHFEKFGASLGLNPKQISSVFKRFLKTKPKAISLIRNSFLSEEMQLNYLKVFEARFISLA